MSIKKLIISEIKLRKTADFTNNNYSALASSIGMSYSGFTRWLRTNDRSIGDSRLDKLADKLGKKIVLIDKEEEIE